MTVVQLVELPVYPWSPVSQWDEAIASRRFVRTVANALPRGVVERSLRSFGSFSRSKIQYGTQAGAVTFGTALLILAIAFSRVYLSVHHPSDVAAGLLVGGFWLLAGIAVAELLRPQPAAAGS